MPDPVYCFRCGCALVSHDMFGCKVCDRCKPRPARSPSPGVGPQFYDDQIAGVRALDIPGMRPVVEIHAVNPDGDGTTAIFLTRSAAVRLALAILQRFDAGHHAPDAAPYDEPDPEGDDPSLDRRRAERCSCGHLGIAHSGDIHAGACCARGCRCDQFTWSHK